MVWPRRTEGATEGVGLRNMQERVEQCVGTLRILSSASGTVVEAQVPLSNMLPPAPENPGERKTA